MCTLHSFDGNVPDVKARHLDQIERDWQRNSDGASVVMLDDHGNCLIRFQTTKLRFLLSMLKTSKGSRYIVHLRASTTACQGVSGCHMFDSESGVWIYAHNGIVYGRVASESRVDSIQLGHELDNAWSDKPDTWDLPDWDHHSFANVIAYNTVLRDVYIHKSHSGSLHHDGNGNWSTIRINQDYNPVVPGWYTLEGDQLSAYETRPSYSGQYWRWNGERMSDDILRQISGDGGESLPIILPKDIADVSEDKPYCECDDCGDLYPPADMLQHGQFTLCPKCYDWQTGGKL